MPYLVVLALGVLAVGTGLSYHHAGTNLLLRALRPVTTGASPTRLLRLSTLLGLLPGTFWKQYVAVLRMGAYKNSGQTAEALDVMRRTLNDLAAGECPWRFVNAAADLLVNAGRYREALRVSERWSEGARIRGRDADVASYATLQVNQAEALHNLGRDREALAVLDAVEPVIRPLRFAANGMRCLRSWILVHCGQLQAARDELARLDVSALPLYRAEVCYTHAALERESGDLQRALEYAEEGCVHARRASSVRNGRLMLGSIAALAGDGARALSVFNEAVDSDYQRQGGDGLLRFAALLERQHDREGALRVYRLLIQRDPESVFATRAQRKLWGSGTMPDTG